MDGSIPSRDTVSLVPPALPFACKGDAPALALSFMRRFRRLASCGKTLAARVRHAAVAFPILSLGFQYARLHRNPSLSIPQPTSHFALQYSNPAGGVSPLSLSLSHADSGVSAPSSATQLPTPVLRYGSVSSISSLFPDSRSRRSRAKLPFAARRDLLHRLPSLF
jgi:hypothetical protein